MFYCYAILIFMALLEFAHYKSISQSIKENTKKPISSELLRIVADASVSIIILVLAETQKSSIPKEAYAVISAVCYLELALSATLTVELLRR